MLVLSRRINESVIVDENIVVTVLEIKGRRVRIGINAPGEIGIHRGEVWAEMKSANNSEIDEKSVDEK